MNTDGHRLTIGEVKEALGLVREPHTPGPWAVGQYTPSEAFRAIANHSCVCDPNTLGLIAVCGPAGDPQSQADADLIAAAPDLLAACESLLDRLEREGTGKPETWAAIDDARAAIARARGDLPPASKS